MKNLMGKIKAASGKIDAKYTPKVSEITELIQESGGTVEIAFNSFVFGFMQGQKVARAEAAKGSGRVLLPNVVTEPREAAHARFEKALTERETQKTN